MAGWTYRYAAIIEKMNGITINIKGCSYVGLCIKLLLAIFIALLLSNNVHEFYALDLAVVNKLQMIIG